MNCPICHTPYEGPVTKWDGGRMSQVMLPACDCEAERAADEFMARLEQRLTWKPPSELSFGALCGAARDRRRIRLRDGRIAKLIKWPPGEGMANQVRCETDRGARFSAYVRDVEAVEL